MDDVIGDLQRRLANIIRRGVISEVQPGDIPKCRVEIGDIVTGWLPVCQGFAGSNRSDSNPASVGDPVTVLSEGGDLNNGRVYPGCNTGAMLVPDTDENMHVTRFSDGTEIRYDREAHALTITLAEEGTYTLKGIGTLDGPVTITGTLDVHDSITSTADISDSWGSMSKIRIIYNGHAHVETDSVTKPPNEKMS